VLFGKWDHAAIQLSTQNGSKNDHLGNRCGSALTNMKLGGREFSMSTSDWSMHREEGRRPGRTALLVVCWDLRNAQKGQGRVINGSRFMGLHRSQKPVVSSAESFPLLNNGALILGFPGLSLLTLE